MALGSLLAVTGSAFAGNCPGANPNDWVDDTPYLQPCLNRGGLTELDPGSPGYIISNTLYLQYDYTELRGTGGKATILADPNLKAPMIKTADNLYGYPDLRADRER